MPAQGENIQALYDAANDLPSDDPLRSAPAAANAQPPAPAVTASSNARPQSGAQTGNSPSLPTQAVAQPTQSASPPASTVVVADAGQLRVPSLLGLRCAR